MSQTRSREEQPGRIAREWLAVLGGAVVWTLAFGVHYALVEVGCGRNSTLPLHLTSATALLLSLIVLLWSLRLWREAGRPWADEGGTPQARSRFMVVLALLLNALFTVTIVAEWLGSFFLHPCMGV